MSIEVCIAGLLVLIIVVVALVRYAWVHWIMSEEEIEAEHRRLLGRSRRW
jgi:hypothetical protein